MGIIADIQNLLYTLQSKKTATEIGRIFNRERKWLYRLQQSESFVINSDFIAGLDSLGYEIVLRKK